MKLKKLFWNRINTIQTFPISHILLLIISIILIWEVEWFINTDEIKVNITLVLMFIISCYWPLFIIHSNKKNKTTINRILQIWSIIIWWLYYLIIHNIKFDNITYSEWLIYIWILPLTLLWIVLIIALLNKKNEQKTWYCFSSLIISIIFWIIAWSILWWWISWALASIKALFDVNIDSNVYIYIWIISEIFLAWSFILNYYLTLTENINNKNNFEIKPSLLRKIFWSYIFIPLTIIYLIIFCTYWLKILITWVRPRWIIIRLWIWYFILWMVSSSYLTYTAKNKTNEIIHNILYISFILVAFIMIWAIIKRINQYWITINRCLICYIIAFIIIYSTLSLIIKKKRFLLFMSTLSIIFFIAIYGRPINASTISFNSQVKRLKNITNKNNLSLPLSQWSLENINEEDTKWIILTLDELVENHDKDKIINKLISYKYENNYRDSRYEIREFLWANTWYDYYYPTYKFYNFWQNWIDELPIDISWYSKIFNFDWRYIEKNILKLNIDNQIYELNLNNYLEEFKERSNIYNKENKSSEEKEILSTPAIISERENYKIVINWFSIEENKDNWTIDFNNIEWYILIK